MAHQLYAVAAYISAIESLCLLPVALLSLEVPATSLQLPKPSKPAY